MRPLLRAVAGDLITGEHAWRAWEGREAIADNLPVSREEIAKERPADSGHVGLLEVWCERFALFTDRLPNLADDKDRQALRNLGYTGEWSV